MFNPSNFWGSLHSWGGVIKFTISPRPNSFTAKIPYTKMFHGFSHLT